MARRRRSGQYPSFAPPGGVRGAGAGRLLPPIQPPTSGLAWRRRRRGARRYRESASLHLSPLTSGLARRRRREFAFYNAPRCRRQLRTWRRGGGGGVHSWTWSLLSTPLAANFGAGPEARRRGGLRDGEPAFHRLSESPNGSGLARRQWRRGIWTKSLRPCASRRRLRADGRLAGPGRTVATAGSCWPCCRSQECSAPSPSRILHCRLFLTLTEGKKWPETHHFLPGRLARWERHRRCTYYCCGTPPLLDSCSLYACAGLYLYTFGLGMCADSTTT